MGILGVNKMELHSLLLNALGTIIGKKSCPEINFVKYQDFYDLIPNQHIVVEQI